jgi:triosephosphate isomerase
MLNPLALNKKAGDVMISTKPLIVGNWKMNGLRSATGELHKLIDGLGEHGSPRAEVMVCPPATLVMAFAHIATDSPLQIGAQDCHTEISGAYTGDVSAEMLADAGASAVILGHSERRAGHGERDRDVQAKARGAYRAGLQAIICVGETEGQRQLGLTFDVLRRQLHGSVPRSATRRNTIIAYEPVWAIGTGKTPTREEIGEAHNFIAQALTSVLGGEAASGFRILYGGSVTPDNATMVLSAMDVHGALVGGASLKADSLLAIASAQPQPQSTMTSAQDHISP